MAPVVNVQRSRSFAALFVAGKADPTAGDRPRTRALPAPVGVDGATDPVGEDFLGDLGPPDLAGLGAHADGRLLGVPPLAQPVEGGTLGLDAGGVVGVDAGLICSKDQL